jgi:carboxypeptidase Q
LKRSGKTINDLGGEMIRRYLGAFLILCLLLMKVASAQALQEKIDLEVINKIKEEGLKRSQLMEILSYLTDVYGPRLTGSPNIKAGQEWARQKLAEWGLREARLEAWGQFGRGWSLEGFTANLIKPQFSPLIAYPKAWSPSTNGIVRGEVVYLDAKNEAELEKYKGKLKGAIVLLAPLREVKAHFEAEAKRTSDERLLELANAEPQVGPARRFEMTPEQRAQAELVRKKWELCYSEGAAVVLEPSFRGDGGTIFVGSVTYPTPVDLPFDRRPRPWAKDAPPAIPQVVLAVEHYNRLIRMITKGVRPQLEVSITSRFHDDDLNGYNVIAEIPGSDLKDEVVMLGAHFDSWHSGTGATDNAAGSAVCLEAVRILQAIGVKPRRTIRIGLWSGEEQGLLGSRAYVEQHFGRRVQPGQDEKPLLELKPEHSKLAAYFNLDNGTGGIRGVYMQGNEAVRPIFRAWLTPFKEWIPNSRVLSASTLSAANTGGTDHLSFDAVGLPGFQFIQDPIEYDTRTHHSNMDVYDRIQEDDMKQAAVIMASFVYNAAMRDQKLPRKPLPGHAPNQASR